MMAVTGQCKFSKKHGANIRLLDEGAVAERIKWFKDDAVVFSENPVPVGTVFKVHFMEKKAVDGTPGIGLTSLDPLSEKAVAPQSLYFCMKKQFWVVRHQESYHAQEIKESSYFSEDLKDIESLGVLVSEEGDLHLFVNDEDVGVLWKDLPTDKPLWGIVDVFGKLKKIRAEYADPQTNLKFEEKQNTSEQLEGILHPTLKSLQLARTIELSRSQEVLNVPDFTQSLTFGVDDTNIRKAHSTMDLSSRPRRRSLKNFLGKKSKNSVDKDLPQIKEEKLGASVPVSSTEISFRSSIERDEEGSPQPSLHSVGGVGGMEGGGGGLVIGGGEGSFLHNISSGGATFQGSPIRSAYSLLDISSKRRGRSKTLKIGGLFGKKADNKDLSSSLVSLDKKTVSTQNGSPSNSTAELQDEAASKGSSSPHQLAVNEEKRATLHTFTSKAKDKSDIRKASSMMDLGPRIRSKSVFSVFKRKESQKKTTPKSSSNGSSLLAQQAKPQHEVLPEEEEEAQDHVLQPTPSITLEGEELEEEFSLRKAYSSADLNPDHSTPLKTSTDPIAIPQSHQQMNNYQLEDGLSEQTDGESLTLSAPAHEEVSGIPELVIMEESKMEDSKMEEEETDQTTEELEEEKTTKIDQIIVESEEKIIKIEENNEAVRTESEEEKTTEMNTNIVKKEEMTKMEDKELTEENDSESVSKREMEQQPPEPSEDESLLQEDRKEDKPETLEPQGNGQVEPQTIPEHQEDHKKKFKSKQKGLKANIPTREHRSKTFGFSFSTKKASSKRKSSLQNSELQQDTSKDSLQRNEAHNSTVSEAIDGADGPVTDQSNKEDAEEKTNNDNEAVASLKIDEELTVTSEQPSSTGADESEVSKEKQLQTSASVDHYKTDQAKANIPTREKRSKTFNFFSSKKPQEKKEKRRGSEQIQATLPSTQEVPVTAEDRNIELQAKLDKELQRNKELQRDNNKLQGENFSLTKTNTELREQLIRIREEKAETEQTLSNLQASLSREVADISFWEASFTEVEVSNHILGSGSCCIVSVGWFRGQKVAVKQLHPKKVSSLDPIMVQKEISLMSKLHHPNLLTLVAAALNHPNGSPVLLHELMDTSLRLAYQEKRLDGVSSKLSIMRDVAAGLNYLHLQIDPIIHRDITSANVLLLELAGSKWRAKLSDFGSAKLARLARAFDPYTAPEVATAPTQQPDQSPKLDVFSYGVLLCEVIAEEYPDQKTLPTMQQSISHSWPEMHKLIIACVQTDPIERLSMAEVLEKLPAK